MARSVPKILLRKGTLSPVAEQSGPLLKSFFDQPHLDVARLLVGCELTWDGVGGTIVETEAYAADGDPACHTFRRPAAREFLQRHDPGTVYVFLNYGIHWLLNVLARDGIILFRALAPTRGIPLMQRRRGRERSSELCSGPGRLGQAIALSGEDHGTSLVSAERHIRGRAAGFAESQIVTDVRVGLSCGLRQPWRFLLAGNPHLSIAAGRAAATRRPTRIIGS